MAQTRDLTPNGSATCTPVPACWDNLFNAEHDDHPGDCNSIMEAAGTAVGIASLGIQVCQGLLSYYEAWRSYHQDICDACNKASELEKTFALLNDTLQTPDLEPERRARVAECLTSCKSGLDRFQKKYLKLSGVTQPSGTREKAVAAAKRSLYPFKVSTLAKLTEMVEDLVRHLSFAVQILQVSLMKDSRSDIAAVGAMTQNLTFKVSFLQTEFAIWQKDDKYRRVMAWLDAPDPVASHNTARHKHEAGTGSWILRCDSYLHWLQNPGSHLWLNGKAGSEKTVLCSTVIQDLDTYDKNTRDIILAYFYFSFSEANKQSFDSLLASLITQLCNSQPPFKHLEKAYDKQMKPSRTLLIETLSIACKQYGEVIIVLDALDELPEGKERRDVLAYLAELKRSATNVKAIVSSRNLADIEESVMSYGAVSLPIDLAQVNEDIRLYVENQFSQAPRLQSWRPEMQRRVQETFQVKADGM